MSEQEEAYCHGCWAKDGEIAKLQAERDKIVAKAREYLRLPIPSTRRQLLDAIKEVESE